MKGTTTMAKISERKRLQNVRVTLATIDILVADIKADANVDAESAHSTRDWLYVFALEQIAIDPKGAQRIARAALEAKSIKLKWETCA